MKAGYIITVLVTLAGSVSVFGQYEGRKFIEGGGSIAVTGSKSAQLRNSSYSHFLSVSLGRFKTENRAAITKLSYGFNIIDNNWTHPNVKGLTSFSAGIGRSWIFYKHLSKSFGVYGGPETQLDFSKSRGMESIDAVIAEHDVKSLGVGFSISAGAYYVLSDRWWLRASIGAGNIFNIRYKFGNYEGNDSNGNVAVAGKTSEFNYYFEPRLALPSVGLGLTYFLK